MLCQDVNSVGSIVKGAAMYDCPNCGGEHQIYGLLLCNANGVNVCWSEVNGKVMNFTCPWCHEKMEASRSASDVEVEKSHISSCLLYLAAVVKLVG